MSKHGFTLVELLIVIAIFLTILGLGIASFNSFNRRERLKQTALNFKAFLRLSQTKAISAQKPSSDCTTYAGVRVSFSANTYSAQHSCTPEGVTGEIDSVTLPGDITFLPVPADFTFLTLTHTIDNDADETINLTNGTQTYGFILTPNGGIVDVGL